MAIFSASFGDVPVRFIRERDGGVLRVVRQDVIAAVKACMCMPEPVKEMLAEAMCQGGPFQDGDAGRIALGGAIEPTLNIFGALEMILGVEGLQDRDEEELRETGRRTHALLTWMIHAVPKADKALGSKDFEFLGRFAERLDRTNPAFHIAVIFDPETKMWIGTNDDLPVATEAPSYEELEKSVRLIAPEMAVENGLRTIEDEVRLYFDPPWIASAAVSL